MLVAPEITTDIIGIVLTVLIVAIQALAQPDAKLASVGAAAVDPGGKPQSK
jgi:hypothetical protein